MSARWSQKILHNDWRLCLNQICLNALSLTARQELAKDNIVVSVFHPKMTATEFGQLAWRKIFFERRAPPGMMVDTAEAVAGRIVEQIEAGGAEAQM